MKASERDRSYLRKLGALQDEGARARAAAHRTVELDERIRRSLALARRFRRDARTAARVDDPTPFYELACRLGLYRP